jgi:hypothetical protein
VAGWKHTDSGPWLIVAAANSTTGAAATVYLLRNINPELFFGPRPLSEIRRKPLLQRWYRVHALRLTASAVALTAIHQARTIRLKNHA